jgi:hypothetical protein
MAILLPTSWHKALAYQKFWASNLVGSKCWSAPHDHYFIGIINLGARVCTKVFKLPHSELSSIIGDNVVEYAKQVHDLLDEFHCLSCYNGGGELHFDPLYEFIHYYENVFESTFDFLEWTYQIQAQVEKGHVIGMVCN